MAGPVRSFCIARGSLGADAVFHTIYTVPAGFILLVKSISLTSPTGAASFAFWFAAADGSAQVLIGNLAVQLNTPVVINNWWVLNSGDRLVCNATQTQVDYWFSGALLPFVQTLPAVAAVSGASSGDVEPLPPGYDPASATPRSPVSI